MSEGDRPDRPQDAGGTPPQEPERQALVERLKRLLALRRWRLLTDPPGRTSRHRPGLGAAPGRLLSTACTHGV